MNSAVTAGIYVYSFGRHRPLARSPGIRTIKSESQRAPRGIPGNYLFTPHDYMTHLTLLPPPCDMLCNAMHQLHHHDQQSRQTHKWLPDAPQNAKCFRVNWASPTQPPHPIILSFHMIIITMLLACPSHPPPMTDDGMSGKQNNNLCISTIHYLVAGS